VGFPLFISGGTPVDDDTISIEVQFGVKSGDGISLEGFSDLFFLEVLDSSSEVYEVIESITVTDSDVEDFGHGLVPCYGWGFFT
jgi:hypothetical protein